MSAETTSSVCSCMSIDALVVDELGFYGEMVLLYRHSKIPCTHRLCFVVIVRNHV